MTSYDSKRDNGRASLKRKSFIESEYQTEHSKSSYYQPLHESKTLINCLKTLINYLKTLINKRNQHLKTLVNCLKTLKVGSAA